MGKKSFPSHPKKVLFSRYEFNAYMLYPFQRPKKKSFPNHPIPSLLHTRIIVLTVLAYNKLSHVWSKVQLMTYNPPVYVLQLQVTVKIVSPSSSLIQPPSLLFACFSFFFFASFFFRLLNVCHHFYRKLLSLSSKISFIVVFRHE